MRTAFIGHFDPEAQAASAATSAAGNQVQRKIFKELGLLCGESDSSAYVMWPQPAWPRGKISVRSRREAAIQFVGYANLPVLKHVIFAARLLAGLVRDRPCLCVHYNSYLYENVASLIYRFFFRRAKLVMILQDVNLDPAARPMSKRWLRGVSERFAIRIVRGFDLAVPISPAIVEDFGLRPDRCFVFQGGVTDVAISLDVAQDSLELCDIGVFAGALEPYNGVGVLVDRWLAEGIPKPLHVFGHGSLSEHVRTVAQQSNRIVYHGFQRESVVLAWQRTARWNFCLRYSIGLNQAYFFPSKLFNLMCMPGAVVVNDFVAIPASLRSQLCIVNEDLSDLMCRLNETALVADPERINRRRRMLAEGHSWRACIRQIVKVVGVNTDA